MTNQQVLWGAVLVATLAFAWVASSVLGALSYPAAKLGFLTHKALKLLPHNEQDAWLFALLMSVTRVVVLLLAVLAWGVTVSTALLPLPDIALELRNSLLNLLWILLFMRLLAIYAGGVVIGGSVRTVLRTLKA